jgi:hypothetical protein
MAKNGQHCAIERCSICILIFDWANIDTGITGRTKVENGNVAVCFFVTAKKP